MYAMAARPKMELYFNESKLRRNESGTHTRVLAMIQNTLGSQKGDPRMVGMISPTKTRYRMAHPKHWIAIAKSKTTESDL